MQLTKEAILFLLKHKNLVFDEKIEKGYTYNLATMIRLWNTFTEKEHEEIMGTEWTAADGVELFINDIGMIIGHILEFMNFPYETHLQKKEQNETI